MSRRAGTRSGGLSVAADHHRGADHRGHGDRYPGAALWRQARQAFRPAGGDRQPARRRRTDRRADGRELRPRRLHRAVRQFRPCHPRHAQQELAIRSSRRFRRRGARWRSAPIVVVPPSLGVSSLMEFVALAKAKPGAINYGSAGIGTSTHLAGAYFALKAGIDLVHVPYTVSATIIADLLGGRIQASFVPMAFVLPLLQDGRLKALAVAAKEPITEPIAIATAQSQGVDYQYATWYGVLAPGKTPKRVLDTLDQGIAQAGNDPELQAKIRIQGIEPRHIALEAFDAHIRGEMVRLAPLLNSIGEKR